MIDFLEVVGLFSLGAIISILVYCYGNAVYQFHKASQEEKKSNKKSKRKVQEGV